jgi:hypothetical protein
MPKFKDKTGMTFGSLTVVSRAENKGKQVYWNCKCSCGKEICVRGDRLTESQVDGNGSPSCGHVRIERAVAATKKDLLNQVFDRLTVIKETNKRSNNGSVIWLCKCSCGNLTEVSTDMLLRKENPTRSCGCLQRESSAIYNKEKSKELIGTVVNGFKILDIESRKTNAGQGENWIYSKCPFCGREKWFQLRYIRNGDTKSCGCIQSSSGEKKIEQILKEAKIPYEKEKTFQDLRFKDTQALARYDFYVNNKYLIEFDGKQHFKPQRFGSISKEESEFNFIKLQEHDKIKNQYAKEHNIPLIRISYERYNELCLNDLLLETSNYII